MENTNELLEDLRTLLDEKESIESGLKVVKEKIEAIKYKLLDVHKSTGLDKLSGGGMSVSFNEKMRAKYEPERWHDIVKWAVETDNLHLVQRRLTDAKVEELIVNGVELPLGLTMEAYVDVSTRRI